MLQFTSFVMIEKRRYTNLFALQMILTESRLLHQHDFLNFRFCNIIASTNRKLDYVSHGNVQVS